ncbi:MAG: hypothetical protein AAF357_00980 [Verrucomicrobiota bacterium]
MATDGAEFGRSKACYGKAYSAAKDGIDDIEVARQIVKGVERDIRFDKGAPAFKPLVQAIVLAPQAPGGQKQFLEQMDLIGSTYADRPLTRDFVAAAEKVGLKMLDSSQFESQESVAARILTEFADSRCCKPMTPYLTRQRTKSWTESKRVMDSIVGQLERGNHIRELGIRMLNGSSRSLPAKATKPAPIVHTASDLNSEVIG